MLIKKGRYSVVIPGCCEKSIHAKIPFLSLNYRHDSDEPKTIDKAKPEWRCPNMSFEQIMKLNRGDHMSYYNSDLSLSFCPFCGVKLPEVVRVVRAGLKVHADLDGGYYCGTCKERNMNCECLPEVVLFDVKPT